MLTGTIRNQVDQIWNAFWSGRVSNPLSVVEQLYFLMSIKRFDDLYTVEKRKAKDFGRPIAHLTFPEGHAHRGEFFGSQLWQPNSFGTLADSHLQTHTAHYRPNL
ncbi:type I restriction-modification system subunit M N-terminal domain-containing protein [Mameliella alba]|uniref:type I restriction-modification system subunit M N-terminal domain-containing protein n=1 Tax=Mameliella alba TaxID=561184 RepID=UPI001ADC2FD9|nr:type I restriction-modification system subunit M N-terminal domain-containing protein [Mameliella alba]